MPGGIFDKVALIRSFHIRLFRDLSEQCLIERFRRLAFRLGLLRRRRGAKQQAQNRKKRPVRRWIHLIILARVYLTAYPAISQIKSDERPAKTQAQPRSD